MTRILVTVCCSCKKEMSRRLVTGEYKFKMNMSGNPVSHGICPKCGPKLYGKYWEDIKEIK